MKKNKDEDISDKEVGQEIAKFKDNLKSFKKFSKKDLYKGIKIAEEIVSQITYFRTTKNSRLQKFIKSQELDKLEDSMLLYLDNVTNLLAFKEKYNKKRGVKK